MGRSDAGARLRASVSAALSEPPKTRVAAICAELAAVRPGYFRALPVARRLALIDAMRELDTEVQLAFQEIDSGAALSRRELLQISRSLLECAYASGLLSADELATVAAALDLADDPRMTIDGYRAAVSRLKRTPGWAIGTIRHTFAEALIRYGALDSRAARFSDDLLRGSPMWMLGDTLKTLSRDVDSLSGSVVEIAGQSVGGAVALNSGVARGTL